MKNILRKLVFCTLCSGFVCSSVYTFNQTAMKQEDVFDSVAQTSLQKDEQEIGDLDAVHMQEVARQVLKEAHILFDGATTLLDKLLYSSYEKDQLTFKDFVWGLKRISTSIEHNIVAQLKTLRSDVKGDTSLSKVLNVVQTAAVELNGFVSKVCQDLNSYERTRNTKDAYKIAKVLQQNVEKFATQARFNRIKTSLDEILSILSKKSGFNDISTELNNLKEVLKGVTVNGSVKIDHSKVLSRIIKRIYKN